MLSVLGEEEEHVPSQPAASLLLSGRNPYPGELSRSSQKSKQPQRAESASNINRKSPASRSVSLHHSNANKVLLLGSAESGKGTLVRGLQLLFSGEPNSRTMKRFILTARRNLIDAVNALVMMMGVLDLRCSDANQEHLRFVAGIHPNRELRDPVVLKQLLTAVAALRSDESVQETLSHWPTLPLFDATMYYLYNAERLLAPDCVLSHSDILNLRLPDSRETKIAFEDRASSEFVLYNLGDRPSDRQSWVHHFDGTFTIVFVAPLTDFNQAVADRPEKNRLVESLQLFESVLSLPWLADVPVVLIFSKLDIFRDKVKRVDLTQSFPDYAGGKDAQSALLYIQQLYVSRTDRNVGDLLHLVSTNLTNLDSIRQAWETIRGVACKTRE